MLILRPVAQNDLTQLHQLASAGGVGITTLPADHTYLSKRIELSLASFASTTHHTSACYLFVLVDSGTNKLVGTAAIDAQIGISTPFYSFRMVTLTPTSYAINKRISQQVLHVVNDYQGCTEIGGLFLLPEYRRDSNGMFLSRARFLFMAQFMERFSKTIVAEMRGVADSAGNSPFWQALGQHFFEMDYATADQLTTLTDKQFITDLMPHYPIYVNLLPPDAQAVIGQPHSATRAAVQILQREGFAFEQNVDIFDAGPLLQVPLKNIRTVQHSQVSTVTDIVDDIDDAKMQRVFAANTSLAFRACQTNIYHHQAKCMINRETAAVLQLNIGHSIHFISI